MRFSQLAVAGLNRLSLAGTPSTAHGPGECSALVRANAARKFASATEHNASEEDLSKARQWYKGFSHDAGQVIPRTLGEVSYSRSSGPGGQNVNK
jgi:protein subunit release factor B